MTHLNGDVIKIKQAGGGGSGRLVSQLGMAMLRND